MRGFRELKEETNYGESTRWNPTLQCETGIQILGKNRNFLVCSMLYVHVLQEEDLSKLTVKGIEHGGSAWVNWNDIRDYFDGKYYSLSRYEY